MDEFIQVWKQWDWRSDEQSSARFLDALIALADELDLSHMTLRRRLATERRNGATYEEAYEKVIHGS